MKPIAINSKNSLFEVKNAFEIEKKKLLEESFNNKLLEMESARTFLRPLNELKDSLASIEDFKQEIINLNEKNKTITLAAIDEHKKSGEKDTTTVDEKYSIEMEELKQQVINAFALQTDAIIEFINKHITLLEIDYDLYNSYQHLKQTTEMVALEILKYNYNMELFDLFIKHNDLSQHVEEYTQRIESLEEGMKQLKRARNYQEKAYQNLFPTQHEVVTTDLVREVNKLEQDLQHISHKSLLYRMHIEAKNSLYSLDEDFYQFNIEAYDQQKDVINLNASAVQYLVKAHDKFMKDLPTKTPLNYSSSLAKARQTHGFQKKVDTKGKISMNEAQFNLKNQKTQN